MSDNENFGKSANKPHHRKEKGKKARKRKSDNETGLSASQENDKNNDSDNEKLDFKAAKARNPRAFALQSFVAAERQFRRTQDIKAKRLSVPEVDRSAAEPPPIFIAVVGPPKVGKSILIQNLIRNYTRQKLNNIAGPVTVVAGKKRRLTFYECGNDINSMIDAAKVADLVLLLIDASFGFEMETFEFLNICQVHGFPRIMGVLTHMDMIKNSKQLKKIKKKLKHRFWTELYQGAKLFYLTGLVNGEYRKHEVHNLARFISVMKFKDLGYRLNHSFVVADRYEDLTQPEQIRQNEKCDRNVSLYGYVRGCPLKNNSNIHIPGCGDFNINDVTFLPDPCPLPDQEKKRTLDDRERLLYAPFSGVGGIVYDKDAVYIDLGGSHSHHTKSLDRNAAQSNNIYLNSILNTKNTLDEKLTSGKIKFLSNLDEIEDLEVAQPATNNKEEESETRKRVAWGKNGAFNFDEDDEENEDEDENEEEEDDNSEIEREDESSGSQTEDDDEEDEEDVEFDQDESGSELNLEDEDEDEEHENDGEIRWKSNLKKRAQMSFENNRKQTNWNKLIYGSNDMAAKSQIALRNGDDDFFTVKRSQPNEPINQDNSKYETQLKQWVQSNNEEDFESIRDCFVTGKWAENEDAENLLGNDDNDDDDPFGFGDGNEDDEEVYGDFEDYETGEVHKGNASDDEDQEKESGKQNGKVEDEKKRKTRNEMTKRERLLEKKKRLKEQFDKNFDDKKLDEDPNENEYYDFMSKRAEDQSDLNRLEFEKMEDRVRVEYEGFRPGMYVRIEIKQMPYEFISNFNPHQLLVVGCLSSNESNVGYVQVRLKKHRWYKKILKTKDPLIISLGWRRFQTLPLFYTQDHNMRNRALKYTPQHMHCQASFWGPISSQNTGFLAVQSLTNQTKNFRIAATGVVNDVNKSTQIVKKLKLIGTPLQIFRKTAFVKGMFSSALEASKFEGATIKTTSGIRGQIKKALRNTSVPAGSVRATFEDKIVPSDMIFLKSWYAVEVPKFYAPITNLLDQSFTSDNWIGLKTLGELKYINNIRVMPNENSLYKPITREEKVFAPLKIHKKLEEKLPFKFINKSDAVLEDPIAKQRVAVIREPKEAKMASIMKMFKKVHENRLKHKQEQHQKQINKHKKEMEKVELKRLQKSKELKKQIYRRLGKQDKRNSNQKDDLS